MAIILNTNYISTSLVVGDKVRVVSLSERVIADIEFRKTNQFITAYNPEHLIHRSVNMIGTIIKYYGEGYIKTLLNQRFLIEIVLDSKGTSAFATFWDCELEKFDWQLESHFHNNSLSDLHSWLSARE